MDGVLQNNCKLGGERFTPSTEKKNKRGKCIFEMNKMLDKESTRSFTSLEVAIEITIYICIG